LQSRSPTRHNAPSPNAIDDMRAPPPRHSAFSPRSRLGRPGAASVARERSRSPGSPAAAADARAGLVLVGCCCC
ncbi:MAG: hypothetical protein ACK4UN_12985, partial [Limisphaerales bacterium]